MKLHTIKRNDILIAKNRIRREFKHEYIVSLASSISQNGLIQPVVVRLAASGDITLVAGENRIKAMEYVWNFGQSVKCGDYEFAEGEIPCIYHSELNDLDAFEMELEENIRRNDLTWQESATAKSRLFDLRSQQAAINGTVQPTTETIAKEASSDLDVTRKELLLASHLDDPVIAKATTAKEAFKLLKRKEDLKRNEDLARQVGVSFNSSIHSIENGDCFDLMADMPEKQFDVILTDPPYGINANEFGNSGGHNNAMEHFYDDSYLHWSQLMKRLAPEIFRVAKPQAHAYIFCDIEHFQTLKGYMLEANWNVFRTPLVWVNPTAARAPWPEHGPQRKYQIILYAVKGERPCLRLAPDVITCVSDPQLNHPAQKPVALYKELLSRSVRAGEKVLDCFGGTGTLIPAAHELKCKATVIEKDIAAYGIAVQRLKGLE